MSLFETDKSSSNLYSCVSVFADTCLVWLSVTFTWLLVAVSLFGNDTDGVGGVCGLVVLGLVAFA